MTPVLRRIRNAALIITSPLWVPIAIVVLVTETHFVPQELRLRRRMHQAGRFRHSSTLIGQGGTLIIDSPTFGWAIARLWWTPEDIMSLAPLPPETEEERDRAMSTGRYLWHPFDRWISQRYLCAQGGTAFLVGVWHAGRHRKKLQQRYPAMKFVESWSGGEAMENFMKELDEDKNAEIGQSKPPPENTN